MSGLFGAHKATTHATEAMGIDFQGAQYGPVVPVVYGQNKVSGNCIWYGDFAAQAVQQKQSGGKGGGGGSTTNYTYSASYQLGLCDGPNIGLVTVLDGNSVVNLGSINYSFAGGNAGQSPWSHLSGNAALGYSLTSTFSVQNLALGSSPSIPNWNFVVAGLKQYSASLKDANPADILTDICTDTNHGISFPYLGSLTQYSNYCVANSLLLSPVYDQQQTANQALSDLFKYTNTYVYYSEDQLKVVPLGDTSVTGNGVTFTPNVTPVVNLGTDDFLSDGSGATITIERKAPQDNLNLVRVEFTDASNTYHDSAAVASIDEDMIVNGGRSDDSETVNGCTNASVARFIAQNLVQRAFYVRNTYQFKLSWRYCYLEPTDIVTLTDASLGLNEFPVRITEIEEDGDSALTITAEEFPEGIGHSALYNTQPNGGTNIDQNADPGAVNPPYLFRGPGFLVGNNTPEIWCAVNGSGSLWAACDVYLSHDGTSYTYCGTIASQARYGQLATALAQAAADPDTTNTPNVQLYAPGQLIGGSQTDADNFVTLAMVDTEIMSYETATLVAANEYTLSYLRRGGYGSANLAHSTGAPWVRLDDSIFRIPVDPSLIGSTVYLKFLSMNCFGRTPRTLAEETAYTYVVGTNVELPDVPDVPASFAVLPVADGVSITWSNDNPQAVGCTSIEYATASGGPFTVLAQEGPTTTSFHHAFTTGATYYYRSRARGPLPQSGWSAYTSVISSTGVNVTGTNGLTTTIANNTTSIAANVPLIINPYFTTGDLTGWTSDHGTVVFESGTNGPASASTTYARRNGSSGTPSEALRNLAKIPVYAGAVVKAQCSIRGINSPDGFSGVRISWRDATDTEISNVTGNTTTGNATNGTYVTGTAPSGAMFAHVECGFYNQTTGSYTVDNFAASSLADSLDQVPDGSTYGRTVNSYLNANRPVTNFADTFHPNKHLGNIPDDVGSERYAVANIDGNRRALVDFSQVGHLNKNIDNIADGTAHSRTLSSALQNGVPLQFAGGKNVLPNGSFSSNIVGTTVGVAIAAGPICDGWNVAPASGQQAIYESSSTGTDVLIRFLGGTSVPANGAISSSFGTAQTFSCTGGWPFAFSVIRSGESTVGLPAGVTATLRTFIAWIRGDGSVSSTTILDADGNNTAQGTAYQTGAVPNDAVKFYITCQATVANANATPTVVGSAGQLPADMRWMNISVVFGSNLDTEVVDGTAYGRAAWADLYRDGGVNRIGLRIAGSGHMLGDQRNVPSSLSRNLGIVRSATALTASSTGAVTVNAHTITLGSASIAYNAVTNAVTGLTQGQSYYIYTHDNYAGGTQAWNATTSYATANGYDDAYNAGLVTIPSSGTSGGGAGGGGCVCADMWLRRGLTARDLVKRWRWWRPYILRGQDGWHFVRQRPRIIAQPCCRITVADGSTLDCSTSTPVTTATGESVLAPMLYGSFVMTDSGWQRVIEVELLPNTQEVVRICVGGHSFFSGTDPSRRISTHNIWKN